jgi:hypothetical protein
MRSFDPEEEYDVEELSRMNAKPWQVGLLKYNPEYVFWGPHEDYMWKKGEAGWEKPIFYDSWKKMELTLDELNEIVNFYFEIDRESKECEACNGTGYHPDAMWISESFYRHSSPFSTQTDYERATAEALKRAFSMDTEKKKGNNSFPSESLMDKYGQAFRDFCFEMGVHEFWSNRITQDELDELVKEGRLRDFKNPTVEEVNESQMKKGKGFLSHDAINRGILIEQRCKRLGVPKTCPDCEGHGHVFTAPEAHVNLVMWLIHPRKGASRGVEVKNVLEEDLPAIFEFLRQAAERNQQRFSKIPVLEKACV